MERANFLVFQKKRKAKYYMETTKVLVFENERNAKYNLQFHFHGIWEKLVLEILLKIVLV